MPCPRCGAVLPDSARFCPSCGSPAGDPREPPRSSPPIDDARFEAATIAVTSGPTHRGPDDDAPVTRRTPPTSGSDRGSRGGRGLSGWLTASDSISHGRFAPGAILDGRFRLVGLLGRGGMGEVYRADDLRLGQPVALKFLPETLRHDPTRLAQFHNEVRTARQVSHPNVCRVYDIGEANGQLYLSMEYVDGEDLATSLRRIGRFPEDKGIEIAQQICGALSAAHQRGVIHRDLKPANIMLDDAGRVRIMDFGLAAIGQVADVSSGTPAYMAPEQLLGREVTARSDIFSLGLVLYELFTGKRAFTAGTVGDLVAQHQSRSVTPPSSLVTSLNPLVERAILRCLDPDPSARPGSAFAVSAAMPGGDPLAAAIAAGETPSPEMVAASGEGAGLSRVAAWVLFGAMLVGLAASLGLAFSESAFQVVRPEYPPDVLVQRARDVMSRIGYAERPRDEAYGFNWDGRLVEHLSTVEQRPGASADALSSRPTPLRFWYRRSPEALGGLIFHSDLLTPGIVDPTDPPPIMSGMAEVVLDYRGRLISFEAVPPQRLQKPVAPAPVDWKPLFDAAEIDPASLQLTEPLWTWLASSDTRVAWTGTWPESGLPLRVEAAAFGGRPVAFMLSGTWTSPTRMPAEDDEGMGFVILLLVSSVVILVAAAALSRKNIREGRGDRRGAMRLAVAMTTILLGLWVSRVHLVATPLLAAYLLLAVCTAVFYGLISWTLYVALEPYVRRHWPQLLVSWTTLLSGKIADPVVGRDVLIGAGLGVWFSLVIRSIVMWAQPESLGEFPGDVELLLGLRPTIGVVLEEAPYAIRNVLLYFFVLFLFKVLLRRQWAAALAFTAFFTLLQVLQNDSLFAGITIGILYFGTAALVILRWGGLLALVVASFVSSLLFDITPTLDTSAWFLSHALLLIALVLALATWAAYTATGGRLVKAGLLD